VPLPSPPCDRSPAARLQGGLGAVEGRAAAVRSGGAPAGAADAAPSDAAALAQAVVAAEVPVKLLGAMQQVGQLLQVLGWQPFGLCCREVATHSLLLHIRTRQPMVVCMRL